MRDIPRVRAKRLAGATLLLVATALARADEAPPPAPAGGGVFGDVRVALGVGVTFRSKEITGKLAPAAVTFDHDRYEVFLAWFRDQDIGGQQLNGYPAHIGLAPPLWALTASRRFLFIEREHVEAFFGAGVAYLDTSPCGSVTAQNDRTPVLDYTEPVYHGCDKLNGSRLNYALSLGTRLYGTDRSFGLDLAYRHISNAGLTNGNRGEDFITAQIVF